LILNPTIYFKNGFEVNKTPIDMKQFIGIFIFLFTLISCSQKISKPVEPVQNLEISNPITDPNLFIGKHKTKVMVLGVFHFASSLDSYKQKYPFNILEEKRQIELDLLIEKIAVYKPTKILLEWNRIKEDSLTRIEYQKFLQNDFDISNKPREGFQIGFKLAKKLNHKKIYCSDAKAPWFGVDLDWDNYNEEEYLKSKGQLKKASRYDYQSFLELGDSLKTVNTLVDHLIWLNNPDNRLKDHQMYLSFILEGAGDNYLGADNVGRQYRRNLRIFANTFDITDFDQEERILLLYGAAHVWQLRQFFKDSPDFEYIEPNKYLLNPPTSSR